MIRVLQISKYMFPYIGGTEQVARDIANALSLHSDEIEQKIICFNSGKEDIVDRVDNVEVIRCGSIAKISSQSISLTYPRKLKKTIDEFQPDIILLHYPNPFVTHFLLRLSNRQFKLLVYWHLDITKQKILKKLFYRQNLKLINRADKIIGATPVHVNESEFSKYFGDKKYILPYSIDEDRLKISDEEKKFANEIREKNNGKILCFFIGRHVPYKGIQELIEASSKIENKNIKFIIAGSGELTESLEEKAINDDKIAFIGRITDTEWRSYLYACDIFCFPSITRNEAFGLALAEAMYYEKPVVTFTIPGSGVNYVSKKDITCIECGNMNTDEYASAIEMLAENRNLRDKLGKAGRERVLNNFTKERFENNIWKLISNI